MPAMVTKIPPEKSVINPIFLGIEIRADHSIGTGIDNRYRSVTALSTTVTKMSILEMAGWQKSKGPNVSNTDTHYPIV